MGVEVDRQQENRPRTVCEMLDGTLLVAPGSSFCRFQYQRFGLHVKAEACAKSRESKKQLSKSL